MEEDKDSSRGFRVTDRRRFTEDSEAHEETHASEEAEAAAPEPEPAATAAPGPEPARAGGPSPDEPVSFSTFILGLSTQALLHLGDIESPVSGKVERDLGAARHVIDILGILQAKTMNNLEQAEERLLEAVLYDLRMRYVELVRGTSREEA
jgi:3-oxoacyl-ACP reductase-like protein